MNLKKANVLAEVIALMFLLPLAHAKDKWMFPANFKRDDLLFGVVMGERRAPVAISQKQDADLLMEGCLKLGGFDFRPDAKVFGSSSIDSVASELAGAVLADTILISTRNVVGEETRYREATCIRWRWVDAPQWDTLHKRTGVKECAEYQRRDPYTYTETVYTVWVKAFRCQYDRGRAEYQRALRHQQGRDVFFDRGLHALYFEKNDDLAIEAFSEAIRLAEGVGYEWVKTCYVELIQAYRRKEDYEHVLQSLDEAIKVFSPHDNLTASQFLCDRGDLYSRRGEYNRAIRDYDEALRLYPRVEGGVARRDDAIRKLLLLKPFCVSTPLHPCPGDDMLPPQAPRPQ